MGAWLIELISNLIDITGNPIADTVIFAIITSISASIAFGLTGFISNTTKTYNSKMMSDLHWSIRTIIFATLVYILVKISQFIRWIFNPPIVYYLIGIIVAIIICVLILIMLKKPKPLNLEMNEDIDDKKANLNPEEVRNNSINKGTNNCPYCEGLLVDRQGPYGNFLGCSNFPNCKYTRNYNLGGRND